MYKAHLSSKGQNQGDPIFFSQVGLLEPATRWPREAMPINRLLTRPTHASES